MPNLIWIALGLLSWQLFSSAHFQVVLHQAAARLRKNKRPSKVWPQLANTLQLSPLECRVLELLELGLNSRLIAIRLATSTRHVQQIIKRINDKAGSAGTLQWLQELRSNNH